MTERLPVTPLCSRCGSQNEARARYCSTCGASLWPTIPPTERQPAAPARSATIPPLREPHRADPLLGLVIADRYRVLELIGRGGMGVVYRAEHARIGKILALKLLTGELTRHSDQVGRFKREALMASRLSHPNTVQVFDFGDADGLAYLAMEYVRGENLGALVDRLGPLGADRTARIVVQICSSLAEAHEKGIVHRDLKPENIMVVKSASDDDVAKVLDFGLAKLRESSELSEVTLSGAIVGTPYYMAPEQIRGEAVGPAADVYALGALMYSCLTGTVVFEAQTPMGVLTRHLVEEPEPPSARAPGQGLSKSLDRLVLSALAKDPAGRPASVTALQQALVEELRGGASRSGVDVLLDRGRLATLVGGGEDATRDEVERYERKLRRRGRLAWTLLGAGGIGALAGGAHLYGMVTAAPVFQGSEIEPNNAASEALNVPFPLDAKGRVGQRLDPQRGDRDFYRVSVPPGTEAVALSLEPLPNMGICAWLYASGSDDPFGRYCGGSAATRLEVPALKLEPGQWVIAVMQDRETYFEGNTPPVFENVSDDYRIALKPARVRSEHELEPNDSAQAPNAVAPGVTFRGRLAWSRDVDVLCSAPGPKEVRFVVDDAVEKPRARASVLEVKPKSGPERDVPVRVHRAGVTVPKSPRDSSGTWRSEWIESKNAGAPCIELALAPNPWAPPPVALVPPPGGEEYVVRVETK
ncbi:MAG TPA: serine/threonine-protein kinase [Polyangiaceae bacterium]